MLEYSSAGGLHVRIYTSALQSVYCDSHWSDCITFNIFLLMIVMEGWEIETKHQRKGEYWPLSTATYVIAFTSCRTLADLACV